MNKENISWLAGLLEGEGHFGFQNTPRVEVNMIDRDIIQKVAKMFDKPGQEAKHLKVGQKNAWYIGVYGNDALEIMMLILPHMGKRRTQRINEILELSARRPGVSGGLKLRKEYIPWIRALGDSGAPHKLAAEIFEVGQKAIRFVVQRKSWTHVS